MNIKEFVELVNDADSFPQQYPLFLAAWVIPHREAFRQYVMEVLCLENITHDEWMADKIRLQHGWPQQVEAAYNAFIKEYEKKWTIEKLRNLLKMLLKAVTLKK
jgi:hypothetical protein